MRSNMGKTTASRPQQSKEDEPTRFQDDGLWRKLLTRAQKGTTNHSFFVVDVVEGSMHTSMFCKLGLPTIFMAHHRKSLNEHIILEGPDGHQWPTMLGLQWNSQPCLMHGWKEFAADYNLEIKDQVVFLLFEDSHFLVQVYDVNNNVKRRVLAKSPEKVVSHADHGDHLKVKNVGVQQRMEDVVEKKNADTPQRRGSTKNPLLYFDTESMELGSDRPARKVDANPAHHADLHGYKTSSKENIIHILDSSEEEEEEGDDQAPRKHRKKDASKIPIKVETNSNKMSLRSANKKLGKVNTEDHSQATLQDVSNRIKSQTPSEKKQANLTEPDEDQNDETGRIMDRELGKNPSSSSPDSASNAPSSPERVTIPRRSRRLQRKTGDYEGVDLLGCASSVVRSGKLYKLSQKVKEVPEDVNEPAKKDALKQVVNSEILTSCCSTQQSTMRQCFQQLQESTSKITEGGKFVLNATQTAADIETTEFVSQEMMELAVPGEVGGRAVVKARHKIKVSRDRGKKRTEKPCPSDEEVYKRIAPAKPLNLLYVSRRRPVSPQEKQETLEAAQAYAQNSTNRHYVMQLRTSQVYCGFHLGVHPEFVEAMQLPFTRLKVMLYDLTGKTWEVEWLGDHPKRPGLHSAGWTKFVLEHFIEEGDVCVFELPDPKVFNISVEIFPVVPLVETLEHGWRSHYIIPAVAHTVANYELPDQSHS